MSKIVVFWLGQAANSRGCADLGEALSFAEKLRKQGYRHVCISTEHPDSVTIPGVDSVEGGLTPDGQEYSWRKRR